jgi:hypothetical protein
MRLYEYIVNRRFREAHMIETHQRIYRPASFDEGNPTMTLDRAVLAFAGFMVLLSATLVWLVSPWWLLLTGFVGLNLIQSSITGFCPAALLFKAMGIRPGNAFQ